MKRRLIICIIYCFMISNLLFAQKSLEQHQSEAMQHHFLQMRTAKADFTPFQFATPPTLADIKQYVASKILNLQQSNVDIVLMSSQESIRGTHYIFQQLYNDIPVYSTQIQILVDDQHKVWHLIENTLDLQKVVEQLNKQQAKMRVSAEEMSITYAQTNNLNKTDAAQAVILFESNNEARLAFRFLGNTNTFFGEYLIDATSSELLFLKDKRSFHHKTGHKCGKAKCTNQQEDSKKQNVRTEATAFVYFPDPLTSAQAQYGQSGFIDNNDGDTPQLTAERRQVIIDVTLRNDRYYLDNGVVKISEFSLPSVAPVSTTEPVFNFVRSQSGFEDVNAYYHINVYREYIKSLISSGLDFSQWVDQPLEIDTHGVNGEDNSFHIPPNGSQPHTLRFGEGGVDDAEDADVVIHELGHYISFNACPNCNFGFERMALDEGLCDYLATSYSRSISENNWQNMFSWDGHNEFFAGRDMVTAKHYPENLSSADFHRNGELWAATLMEIWEELGREITDVLLLASLPSFGSNIDMETAAQLFVQTEQQIFGGQYSGTVQNFMAARGFINFVVSAGADGSVCIGDSIQLGAVGATTYNNVELYWSPGISLDDSTNARPFATPDEPTHYVLTLRDLTTGVAFRDTAFIDASYCFDSEPIENLTLLNTNRFLQGRSSAILEVPTGTEDVEVHLFDAFGRLYQTVVSENDNRLEISASGLQAGIYFLQVFINGEKKETFKMAKAR